MQSGKCRRTLSILEYPNSQRGHLYGPVPPLVEGFFGGSFFASEYFPQTLVGVAPFSHTCCGGTVQVIGALRSISCALWRVRWLCLGHWQGELGRCLDVTVLRCWKTKETYCQTKKRPQGRPSSKLTSLADICKTRARDALLPACHLQILVAEYAGRGSMSLE